MKDVRMVGTRFGDLSSLPEQLRKQIKETKSLTIRKQIIIVMKYDLEKTATINEILVCIYRRYKRVLKKQSLYTNIEQMMKTGVLKSIERGIYTLNETDNDL